MSVLIKGVKLPKKQPMRIVLNPNGQLFVDHRTFFEEYEAVELPDHGDLIDRDEAADDACLIWCRNSSGDDSAQEIIGHLRKMKAVIPAERSEE